MSDERITFKPYIQEQLKKACAKAAALRKLCKMIPQDVMIRLYKAYVLPHLEYCSPLLVGISNGLKNKLQDTNYYILRYSSSVFYNFLLNVAELQNLETRRQFQSLVILYKCLKFQGPEYLSEFFNVLKVNYNLTGVSTRLMMPSFNLEYTHKSWSHLTTKLWNGLPTGVRKCPDLAAFRRALWHGFNFAGLSRSWVAGLNLS